MDARSLNECHKDDPGMTQREVAAELGVSKPMIEKIERRAMRKLRERFKALRISLQDFLPESSLEPYDLFADDAQAED